ncbi:hypothetical protein [Lactococcus lactis]|uniref:Phage holin n=1 Tax=Lactococcus lactis TaxID=1358 RepID=A0AAP3Z2K7_9LACT|nr:hypothetical protein [Lactococcus lactis]MDG4969241.1 phage holin [Lactococcus lactis]MDG4977172.1 phage holin [Lactococcus lactis]MDG5103335.1 phage holin [Lactococcus lactis]TNU78238.1 hypothetical protein FIB48_09380 [Lactococcus lactis subsp. lactis]
MKNASINEILSIVTTILTAVGAGYAGLANIWGFPFADQVVSSIAVIVSLISAVLGAFTIKKISDRSASNNVIQETDNSQAETATLDFVEPKKAEVADLKEDTIKNDIAIPKGENE